MLENIGGSLPGGINQERSWHLHSKEIFNEYLKEFVTFASLFAKGSRFCSLDFVLSSHAEHISCCTAWRFSLAPIFSGGNAGADSISLQELSLAGSLAYNRQARGASAICPAVEVVLSSFMLLLCCLIQTAKRMPGKLSDGSLHPVSVLLSITRNKACLKGVFIL